MADAILSDAAGRLIGLIEEQARYHVNLVRGAEDEVHSLAEQLNTIRYVVDDAENRRFKDDNINYWLSKLERTSYDMEDVLDQWDHAILKLAAASSSKRKVRSFIPSSACLCFKKVVVRHEIATKILNVKAQLDGILKEKDRYSFVISQPTDHPLPKSWRDPSISFTVVEQVYGRSSVSDALVAKLMGNGGSILHVVSIVGVGGLGKTTLAQLVYNNNEIQKHFDLRIWICVSDPFDLVAIAKGIIECVKGGDSPSTNNLDTLWRCVRDSISGKKILVVLDDVWTEEYGKWEPLEKNLRCGGEGSKILVTTRKTKVAKIVGTMDEDILYPEMLSDEDCWLLMRSIACLEKGTGVGFEKFGKEIAKKCNGLPLAARTLGSLLRSKNTLAQWEVVLNSDIWEMKEVELELFPHLLLSYNELSPTLKRCFSYCALFPKDYKINVEMLIRYWVALGYLGSDTSSSSMEERGREYFDILAMHSLFQDFEKKGSDGKIISCKMHDIVHDFAQFLRKSNKVDESRTNECTICRSRDLSQNSHVNEFRSLIWNDKESPPNFCDCHTSLRVLSLRKCNLQSIPQIMENFIHLRCLNLYGNELSLEGLKMIFQLSNLKTLNLGSCSLKEIPTEIGNMIHLRYLNLSRNESLDELPREIGNLINLRHLNLSESESLKELPMEIGNLIHLRHLNLQGNKSIERLPETIRGLGEMRTLNVQRCEKLCESPDKLAQLTSLSSLTEFSGESTWSKLGLLKNLTYLDSTVRLMIKLEGDDDLESSVRNAREAELTNKIHIEQLIIAFEDEMDEMVESSSYVSRVREDVINALKPHPSLEKLSISEYKGSKLSGWIVSPLNQLRNIKLIECPCLTTLPSLGKLPCLKDIYIDQLEELAVVGREFFDFHECSSNTSVISFPKLKRLVIVGCGKFKEWEDITAEEEASAAWLVMPRLTELMIIDCNGLTTLPHRLIRKASSLQKLNISDSTQLQERYGNKNGFHWKSISQHNPRLRLRNDS